MSIWAWLTGADKPEPDYAMINASRARMEQGTKWREEILQKGGCDLRPFTNVAHGTYGYEVLRLEFDGLLKGEKVAFGPLSDEYVTRYALTEKGREVAAMMFA